MLSREDREYDKRVRSLKQHKKKRKLSKDNDDKNDLQTLKKIRQDKVELVETTLKEKNSKQKLFIYGNYNRYYGYRNQSTHDGRLDSWNHQWFQGKDCLDIGCNDGHLTIEIAKKFNPNTIVGIDIDASLITRARSNITRINSTKNHQFPISFGICHGPIVDTCNDDSTLYPRNILFKQENYIKESMESINEEKPLYDVILCLSLTKWIHLNWGDEGVKKLFKRIFMNLRHDGILILEPQSIESYKKKKRLSATFRKNFDEIKLMPDQFNDYLLSEEIGFSSCQTLPIPNDAVKGM
ncbi:uncharacterized protein TRIADDRAFT_19869 [Trichoplax adhaerens]|uniref:RNA methyltransferase n=1 Tax=Trichoplax adhaerens TaxID=10228 RepID=B3RLM9_TRIAD|nr:hypothetical protein TRIADDRAFT_19869 [Trichoplax adhaerens]EDV29556.1 hypothetical protein TRIADDRAFT_19869 [Trichoplax adhaerens]|eukprot:XP_002108758.1 hypothetical protein TRIADDRAFT_19869 [Trichoplax adhaerens]